MMLYGRNKERTCEEQGTKDDRLQEPFAYRHLFITDSLLFLSSPFLQYFFFSAFAFSSPPSLSFFTLFLPRAELLVKIRILLLSSPTFLSMSSLQKRWSIAHTYPLILLRLMYLSVSMERGQQHLLLVLLKEFSTT